MKPIKIGFMWTLNRHNQFRRNFNLNNWNSSNNDKMHRLLRLLWMQFPIWKPKSKYFAIGHLRILRSPCPGLWKQTTRVYFYVKTYRMTDFENSVFVYSESTIVRHSGISFAYLEHYKYFIKYEMNYVTATEFLSPWNVSVKKMVQFTEHVWFDKMNKLSKKNSIGDIITK